MTKKNFYKLTLVTNKNRQPIEPYLEFILTCIKAGITSVQLREKNLSKKDLLSFGHCVKELLDPFNIPLIINDHVNICLELNAAGVHLGQLDEDIISARQILGPEKIIGLSVNTMGQIQHANNLPIDYIGLGAIFRTQSKLNIETIWELSGLKVAVAISSHPIIAIGGINVDNVYAVMKSGASGVAAIGAFHDAADPYMTTQNLITTINKVHHDRKNRKGNYQTETT